MPPRCMLVIAFISGVWSEGVTSRGSTCGGRLRASAGIISTPHFPAPFPIPIHCKWIIQNDAHNGTITLYFTQQYTTTGLTFTEYLYYDESYKLGESRALVVTEENITKIKYLKVNSPVLVVELMLTRAEGNQLRALGLLSVFGFNVTYAMSGTQSANRVSLAPKASCSALECRLLGHCYVTQDYSNFFCSCFEGYSGPDCGEGPLCRTTSNMCRNGGTCRQLGPAAVSCLCAPGFSGDLCEQQTEPPVCGRDECSEGCNNGRGCDCTPKDTDPVTARLETRLEVIATPDMPGQAVSQEIIELLAHQVRIFNITVEDDIEVIKLSAGEQKGSWTVHVRFWCVRESANALRAALAQLAPYRVASRSLRLVHAPYQTQFQPAVNLHSLTVNQRLDIWEGSEFILSCIAYSSPSVQFTWYKDSVRVNFNSTTRSMWTRTVAEDAYGRRMSFLGISEAKVVDGGTWSCAAEDAGRRRCRALRITVLKPPEIRLVPSAMTINKGDNVSIICLAEAVRAHGVLGFSWAKERSLLPLAPGQEVWEDLYPSGSVLKLYNIQKSSEYRCQVSSVAGTAGTGVRVWALGNNDEACEAEASHGVRWQRTAPGAHAKHVCPSRYSGEINRFCEPKSGKHGVKWRPPDFSTCVADALKDIYDQFKLISYGYSWGNISTVVHQYGAVLRSLPAHPGSGTVSLYHCRQLLDYLLSEVGKTWDRTASADILIRIYDLLLTHPDYFLDEEKIYELQTDIASAASLKPNTEYSLREIVLQSKLAEIDDSAHFSFHANVVNEDWFLTSTGVELQRRVLNSSVVIIHYRSLTDRLPSLRRFFRYEDGREIEYRIASQQMQVTVNGKETDVTSHPTVTMLFTHIKNYSAVGINIVCGLRPVTDPRAWDSKACELKIVESTFISCKCRGFGTYALFVATRSTLTDAENDLRSVANVTIGLGGALCLAAAALQLLCMLSGNKTQLQILLKATTAFTHAAALFSLLECDTDEPVACPGALGWICAACWCIGSAALCAQPLLLQAELAGRTHSAPSVGLLAGVCILALLTARLSGGAPLQLGDAAQAVCATSCLLLAVLSLALTSCAALRLRRVTTKLPAERRNYLRNRGHEVRNSILLLLTTSAVQVAGVAYVMPGEGHLVNVVAVSAASLVNGLTMLVCYVIRDEEGVRSVRKALSSNTQPDSPQGERSLSFYIRQSGEVESRGGIGDVESPDSASTPYWRSTEIKIPTRTYRRQSTPDSRADIVRCVERHDSSTSMHQYNDAHFTTTHAVCDLVSHAPAVPEYTTHLCLQLGVFGSPPKSRNPDAYSSNSTNTEIQFETSKADCILCVQSNPDVSLISKPRKSCLKTTPRKDIPSSVSLPSINNIRDDPKSKSYIEQINKDWKKAYDSPETDKMLKEISNDLNFLLNKEQIECLNLKNIPDQSQS